MLPHTYLPSSSSLVFRATLHHLEVNMCQPLLQLVMAHKWKQGDMQGGHWEEANYSRVPSGPKCFSLSSWDAEVRTAASAVIMVPEVTVRMEVSY